jgi:hypothetical protein
MMADPKKMWVDAALEVTGSEDVTQLVVQGHTTQNAPLQAWEDHSGCVVAQVSDDGVTQAFCFDLAAIAEPASPPAGFMRLFIDQATGKLKMKDEYGNVFDVETELSSGYILLLVDEHTGDPVSVWADESGEENDVQQATASRQPAWISSAFGTAPAVRFDQLDDGMTGSSLTARTVFFLVRANGSGTFSLLAGRETMLAVSSLQTGAAMVVTVVDDGAQSSLQIDENTPVTGDIGTVGPLLVDVDWDGGPPDTVDLALVIVYPTVLSTQDRAEVRAWMADQQ